MRNKRAGRKELKRTENLIKLWGVWGGQIAGAQYDGNSGLYSSQQNYQYCQGYGTLVAGGLSCEVCAGCFGLYQD